MLQRVLERVSNTSSDALARANALLKKMRSMPAGSLAAPPEGLTPADPPSEAAQGVKEELSKLDRLHLKTPAVPMDLQAIKLSKPTRRK